MKNDDKKEKRKRLGFAYCLFRLFTDKKSQHRSYSFISFTAFISSLLPSHHFIRIRHSFQFCHCVYTFDVSHVSLCMCIRMRIIYHRFRFHGRVKITIQDSEGAYHVIIPGLVDVQENRVHVPRYAVFDRHLAEGRCS